MRLFGLSPTVPTAALIVALAAATSAHASPIEFDLTIDYFPASIPDNSTFPSDSTLIGTTHVLGRAAGSSGSSTELVPGEEILVDKHGRVKVQFFWDRDGSPGQCVGVACDLAISFGGMAAQFPAFGFDATGDVPAPVPTADPIIPLGVLLASDAASLHQAGRIVAYDGPVIVGTWDITATAVPLPAALGLYAFGVSALGLLGLRRRRS